MSAENSPKSSTKKTGGSFYKVLLSLCFIVAAFFLGTLFSKKEVTPVIEPIAEPKEEPVIIPTAEETDGKVTDIRTLSKGFDLQRNLEITTGDLATTERVDAKSYVAEYTLKIKQPAPAKTLEQLSEANPFLSNQLLELPTLIENSEVSPHFNNLQKEKEKRTKKNSLQLLKLLTKHNYYDCQTMLNLTHPETGRKAFLVQADMDVVADGSDGDRLSEMPDEIVNSTHYQPFTSYGWAKVTDTPNPMVEGWEQRIENANEEITASETTAKRVAWLKNRKKYLRTGIQDMEKRSFLIAEYDPFIVLSVPIILDRKDPFAPKVGDYCVVFYQEKAYPAIVGDAGPYFKAGEASLRIAKEIDSKASPYHRPISELSATYLVFPNTAEKPHRAPDYEEIHNKCLNLLNEVGGLAEGTELHQWENLLPEKVSPERALPAPELLPEEEIDNLQN